MMIDEHVLMRSLDPPNRWFVKVGSAERALAIVYEANHMWIWRDDLATPEQLEIRDPAHARAVISDLLRTAFAKGMTWIPDALDP